MLTERGLRTVAGVGIPLVLGFALFDYVRHPEVFADSILIRLACVTTILGALLARPHRRSAASTCRSSR